MTEVVCENFQLLEPKSDNENRNNQNKSDNQLDEERKNQPDPFKNGRPLDISDDDLPF